jgi:uncharacterized membrane protein
VGDQDQWFAFGETHPAIDIEKASGAQPGAGAGNLADEPNNVAAEDVHDADTPETAQVVEMGAETPVYLTITNTGDEPLGDLVLADELVLGETALAIDPGSCRAQDEPCQLEGLILAPGASISLSGLLPGLGGDESHGDNAAITATGTLSGKVVEDADPWFARAEKAPIPAIDVEKASGGEPGPGVGNLVDTPDNIAAENVHDADTPETAVSVEAGEETQVHFAITNTGADDLADLRVIDDTVAGPPLAIDPETVMLKGSDKPLAASIADGVLSFEGGFVLKAGETVVFAGAMPGLGESKTHIDKVRVAATGVKSGETARDADPWFARAQDAEELPTPAIDVEKASGGQPGAGVGNLGDEPDNIATDDVRDADTPETAVVVEAGKKTKVYLTITNTGADDLTDLRIIDDTVAGPPLAIDLETARLKDSDEPLAASIADGVLSFEDGFVLKVGEAITLTGAVPSLGESKTHIDKVRVAAVGVKSGETARDADPWFARAEKAPILAIDVEKASGGEPGPGVGDLVDTPDNIDAENVHDADTPETAVSVKAGEETQVHFAVTNTGADDLVDLTITDDTVAGPALAIDLETVRLKGSDEPLAVSIAGGTLSFEDGFVLKVGETIVFTGAMPGLGESKTHIDKVRVAAVGVKSGETAQDADPWFAQAEDLPAPAIDVEKASGGEPAHGAGNLGDEPDNIDTAEVFDADTPETAVAVKAGEETQVHFAVANTGADDLAELRITDETVAGPALAIDLETVKLKGSDEPLAASIADGVLSFEDGFVLKPGETIVFAGVVPGLGDGETHTDQVRAVAAGVESGEAAEDSDPWFARAQGAPVSAIDVEKAVGGEPGPGVGNLVDPPDNIVTDDVHDADTPETAVSVEAGGETQVHMAITNTGADDLINLAVRDETVTGQPMRFDLENVRLKGSDEPLTVHADGGVVFFGPDFVLEVGATVVLTGVVPGLNDGEIHIDELWVGGVGVKSGADVSDEDLLHLAGAEPSTPSGEAAIDVEKFDLRTIALAGKDVKDAAFAEFYTDGDAADRDSDDKALVFYSPEDAERDRIGVIVTNTGGEDLVELKLSDATPDGYAGAVVDWRVLQVAGEAPGKDVTWDDLSKVVLKPGETIVFDGALTGMVKDVVHKDTAAVEGKGSKSGETVKDADDWFAKIATTDGDTTWKIERTPQDAKIILEQTGVGVATLVMLGLGAAVVVGAFTVENRARRRRMVI